MDSVELDSDELDSDDDESSVVDSELDDLASSLVFSDAPAELADSLSVLD